MRFPQKELQSFYLLSQPGYYRGEKNKTQSYILFNSVFIQDVLQFIITSKDPIVTLKLFNFIELRGIFQLI